MPKQQTRTFVPRLSALVLAAVGLVACNQPRFAVCRTNEDCAETGGRVCYNLRCVACRYDVDCSAGQACSPTNVCESLGTPKAQEGGDQAQSTAPLGN